MTKISTLAELKAEQNRLRFQKLFLETEIKKDFDELKSELAPLKLITKSAEKILGSKDNGILGNSLGYIADFVTKNVFLKNSGFITRLIVPYLIKTSTGKLVEQNKSKIVDWVSRQVSKLGRKKSGITNSE